jgi:hypothetical protein
MGLAPPPGTPTQASLQKQNRSQRTGAVVLLLPRLGRYWCTVSEFNPAGLRVALLPIQAFDVIGYGALFLGGCHFLRHQFGSVRAGRDVVGHVPCAGVFNLDVDVVRYRHTLEFEERVFLQASDGFVNYILGRSTLQLAPAPIRFLNGGAPMGERFRQLFAIDPVNRRSLNVFGQVAADWRALKWPNAGSGVVESGPIGNDKPVSGRA